MQMKNIIIAVAALAVGVAVGWFATGVGESSFAKATEDKREGRASDAAEPKRKTPNGNMSIHRTEMCRFTE